MIDEMLFTIFTMLSKIVIFNSKNTKVDKSNGSHTNTLTHSKKNLAIRMVRVDGLKITIRFYYFKRFANRKEKVSEHRFRARYAKRYIHLFCWLMVFNALEKNHEDENLETE